MKKEKLIWLILIIASIIIIALLGFIVWDLSVDRNVYDVNPDQDNSSVNCSSDSYDCSNFSSQEDAQRVYDYCLDLNSNKDVHNLDNDGDGVVCEGLA